MADKTIEWPSWQDVAKGEASPLGRLVSWPLPDHRSPMLRLHQRNLPRRLVRVEYTSNAGSVAGYFCRKGVNFMLVYENELPAIRAKVMTDADRAKLALAQEEYEVLMAEHMKTLTVDTRAGHTTLRETAEATAGFSISSILRRLNSKSTGVPVIARLDVHPELVPAPETPESIASMQAQANAEAMGRGMAMALEERDKRLAQTKRTG